MGSRMQSASPHGSLRTGMAHQEVYVMRESEELAPIDLDELRGLKIEKDQNIVIMFMKTDNMLIACSDNVRELVDSLEKKLNDSFEATPRSKIEHYMGMHVLYNKLKEPSHSRCTMPRVWLYHSHGSASNLRRWRKDAHLSTRSLFEADSPPEIDIKLRDRIWQAHGLTIWGSPRSCSFCIGAREICT